MKGGRAALQPRNTKPIRQVYHVKNGCASSRLDVKNDEEETQELGTLDKTVVIRLVEQSTPDAHAEAI